MDEAAVQDWLNRYVDVWRSGQHERVSELFSEDCNYVDAPYRPSRRGHEEIARYWEESGDAPDAFRAQYSPLFVQGDFAVAEGTSEYLNDDRSAVEKTYHNIFVLWFAPDGRCRDYREWYMKSE